MPASTAGTRSLQAAAAVAVCTSCRPHSPSSSTLSVSVRAQAEAFANQRNHHQRWRVGSILIFNYNP